MDAAEMRAQAKRLKEMSDSLAKESVQLIEAANTLIMREAEYRIVAENRGLIDGFVFCYNNERYYRFPRRWMNWSPPPGMCPGPTWIARLVDGSYLVHTVLAMPFRHVLILFKHTAPSAVALGGKFVACLKPPEAEEIQYYAQSIVGAPNPDFDQFVAPEEVNALFASIAKTETHDCGFTGGLFSNVVRVNPFPEI